MIGGVSSPSYYVNPYQGTGAHGAARSAEQSQNAQRTGGVWTARRSVSPDTPVQPVRPAPAVSGNEAGSARLGFSIRQGADPVEMAVRMRIQYGEPAPEGAQRAAREGEPALGAESVQKALEEGECQTCKERKYQDGSDDAGVSFKTPTNIDPDLAPSAVRGHEMEHVVREQAKAQREDRKVVSQNVTYHTAICPECGRAYVSGGTTRTVTAAKAEPETEADRQNAGQQSRTPFSAVA